MYVKIFDLSFVMFLNFYDVKTQKNDHIISTVKVVEKQKQIYLKILKIN